MNAESPPPPSTPPIVKPLLLEALGTPFLAYVLGASDEEIERWLLGPDDEFGTTQQIHALSQLHLVLHGSQQDGDPELRQLNLSHILSIYQEPFHTTLVNTLRLIATGEALAPIEDNAAPEDILTRLVADAYPLYLLPAEDDPFPSRTLSLFRHPLRSRFEAAISADSNFAQIFQTEDEQAGKRGSLLRSTGRGGSIQLIMLAQMLISAGWRAASIATAGYPSLEDHVEATLAQLAIVRNALTGKPVTIPVRVAFTGVRLRSDKPLDLGWGVLRQTDASDRHLVPSSIDGRLTGTGVDGVNVEIDYSGNVVLETTIEYRVAIRRIDVGTEWPQELRGHERIGQLIESVQLGALLSQDFKPTEPITVLPTWRYVHDPLAHGYEVGWSDPRMSRSFMPKQLDEAAAEKWRDFAIIVEQHRTKHVDVAIRRTLRASAERRDYADMLMDAVIAWENLFGSRKGEPTLRVTGSIAWLLEDKPAARQTLRSELTTLYNLRSDVVHGNRMLSDQELVPKSQRALEVAVNSLRALFTTRLDLLKECKSGDERSNKVLMGG